MTKPDHDDSTRFVEASDVPLPLWGPQALSQDEVMGSRQREGRDLLLLLPWGSVLDVKGRRQRLEGLGERPHWPLGKTLAS